MPLVRVQLLPFASGCLVSLACWLVVDAYVMAGHGLGPHPRPETWIPGGVGALAFVMMIVSPWQSIRAFHAGAAPLYFNGTDSSLSCAKCWLFSTFVTGFAAIMTGVVLVTSSADGHAERAQGELAILATAQATLLMFAALTCMCKCIARDKDDIDDYDDIY